MDTNISYKKTSLLKLPKTITFKQPIVFADQFIKFAMKMVEGYKAIKNGKSGCGCDALMDKLPKELHYCDGNIPNLNKYYRISGQYTMELSDANEDAFSAAAEGTLPTA